MSKILKYQNEYFDLTGAEAEEISDMLLQKKHKITGLLFS